MWICQLTSFCRRSTSSTPPGLSTRSFIVFTVSIFSISNQSCSFQRSSVTYPSKSRALERRRSTTESWRDLSSSTIKWNPNSWKSTSFFAILLVFHLSTSLFIRFCSHSSFCPSTIGGLFEEVKFHYPNFVFKSFFSTSG